ncbi:Uncharacterised protein [uncultured archaeon]|nr:Uncharacterised protein [uncultured archaeon]
MSEFIKHDKIAEMAGIPICISNEINRFIDDINPPKEFEEHNTERKIFVCGHLNVSIRTLLGSVKSKNSPLHDRGKEERVQKEDLKWLLATRKEYIKCYYLHFAIDHINDNKGWMKDTGGTVNDCLNIWEKKHAVIIPGTEPYLRDVMDFLRNNIENIKEIVF